MLNRDDDGDVPRLADDEPIEVAEKFRGPRGSMTPQVTDAATWLDDEPGANGVCSECGDPLVANELERCEDCWRDPRASAE